jgi:hypothetical protein
LLQDYFTRFIKVTKVSFKGAGHRPPFDFGGGKYTFPDPRLGFKMLAVARPDRPLAPNTSLFYPPLSFY